MNNLMIYKASMLEHKYRGYLTILYNYILILKRMKHGVANEIIGINVSFNLIIKSSAGQSTAGAINSPQIMHSSESRRQANRTRRVGYSAQGWRPFHILFLFQSTRWPCRIQPHDMLSQFDAGATLPKHSSAGAQRVGQSESKDSRQVFRTCGTCLRNTSQ